MNTDVQHDNIGLALSKECEYVERQKRGRVTILTILIDRWDMER